MKWEYSNEAFTILVMKLLHYLQYSIFISYRLLVAYNGYYLKKRKRKKGFMLLPREAIYFEARSESFIGQLAVANVILERVSNKYFPNTICKVVKSGKYFKGNPHLSTQGMWHCS